MQTEVRSGEHETGLGNQYLQNHPPPEEVAEGVIHDNIVFLSKQNPKQVRQRGNISRVLVVGFFSVLLCVFELDRFFRSLK